MGRTFVVFCALAFLALTPVRATEAPSGLVAAKPLFRDPIYDGAADPSIIWNPHVGRWWMFYTNRRANAPGLSGVAWVHGTKIGIAESADQGANWHYVGTADIPLPLDIGSDQPTLWAPDVETAPNGSHRMFVAVVPGVFEDWKHPRGIVELTSDDLLHWRNPHVLALASDRVIDPSVCRLADGSWRLVYNNERDHKSTYYADSADIDHWIDRGKAPGAGDQGGEGPKLFRWFGSYWLITDVWRGLAVYRSDDGIHWARQPGENLLSKPGKGVDDGVKGGHPDVYVCGSRAFLFYFTHPGRTDPKSMLDGPGERRSSIQVTELKYGNGLLSCDRDEPAHILLVPASN